ncbi:MAG: transposase [Terriglobia bacterium]
MFTRDFKLATARRLEAGVSLAEVSRGTEVIPNVLHRWRREFRQAPGNVFSGTGQRRWWNARLPSWGARWASRRWRSIF